MTISATEKDRVPNKHPFGSPTDDEHVCSRCRAHSTGCALCAGELVSLIRLRQSDRTNPHR